MNPSTKRLERSPGAQPLDLALIGNCRVAALVDTGGRIVWWCFPRFDSNPAFSRLLSGDEEKGFTDVVLADLAHVNAAYVRNTAIVETELEDRHGGRVRITDFAPRFVHFERTFRPPQIVRRIIPVAGLPRIAIRVRPTHAYGRPTAEFSLGSNHIRYRGTGDVLRLTTDAPLSYIAEETTFPLTRPITLVFGPDEPFQSALDSTARDFEERTRDYWSGWVRSLAVPFEWQNAVTRAAVTLKLCSFEETGGIVAAHTTSIPEAPGSGRNWDYRFCWLRDAYFVVQALNRLGATETMEAYINYILTVAADLDTPLKPVHSIVPGDRLTEEIAPDLAGFQGNGPVRVGNLAEIQSQHDVYGSVILAATQMFVDERLPRMGDEPLFKALEPLGERALRLALTPDAGIWEYRGRQRIHTHSAALCWAACDRLSQIAARLGIDGRAAYWRSHADELREPILARAWNENKGALAGALDGQDLDASVLLLSELGLLAPDDPRFIGTFEAVGRELKRNGRIMRYTNEDDFGAPETAFLVCNFWYIDALAELGRLDEARAMFTDLLERRNAFGILSEDIHPETGVLWGNIPQTYSMAAIINSAMRLSVKWEDAWRRV
ncbi:glycoside hydrolase family 15 protein [Methylocapsa sp. S129]|uniref:glycoside hydrolase family 15 protein n=1 Tax=Methylocapsa sp. S129 TaxID=1641869 RepID=UPI001FEDD0AF|nr:glycoside hydrolase family 15 protein [Methylocapsa sp. S129]